MVFANYSRYYDLLYRDKNYDAEVEFVRSRLQQHRPDARSLLELGCGTGRHAECWVKRGFRIHGVDLSERMLELARSRGIDGLMLTRGDARDVRVAGRFDAVVSLFHVVNYQRTQKDLVAFFATAAAHLQAGGIFIFDSWYGPAVLADRPTVRKKVMEDEVLRVTRDTTPTMLLDEKVAEIRFDVAIEDKRSGQVERLTELHPMRYLFEDEIRSLAETAGFSVLECGEWMTAKQMSESAWNVYFVLRKNA